LALSPGAWWGSLHPSHAPLSGLAGLTGVVGPRPGRARRMGASLASCQCQCQRKLTDDHEASIQSLEASHPIHFDVVDEEVEASLACGHPGASHGLMGQEWAKTQSQKALQAAGAVSLPVIMHGSAGTSMKLPGGGGGAVSTTMGAAPAAVRAFSSGFAPMPAATPSFPSMSPPPARDFALAMSPHGMQMRGTPSQSHATSFAPLPPTTVTLSAASTPVHGGATPLATPPFFSSGAGPYPWIAEPVSTPGLSSRAATARSAAQTEVLKAEGRLSPAGAVSPKPRGVSPEEAAAAARTVLAANAAQEGLASSVGESFSEENTFSLPLVMIHN